MLNDGARVYVRLGVPVCIIHRVQTHTRCMTNHSTDTSAFVFISYRYPLLKIQQIPFDIIINAVLHTHANTAAAHILPVLNVQRSENPLYIKRIKQ